MWIKDSEKQKLIVQNSVNLPRICSSIEFGSRMACQSSKNIGGRTIVSSIKLLRSALIQTRVAFATDAKP